MALHACWIDLFSPIQTWNYAIAQQNYCTFAVARPWAIAMEGDFRDVLDYQGAFKDAADF